MSRRMEKAMGLLLTISSLAHLNALYNSVYPGLRFITFVNGRSRAEIVNVIEDAVGIPRSPEPLPDEYPVNTPALDSDEIRRLRRDPVSAEWRTECDRAVGDVWLIAKARIRGLGLE
jgi:2-oxo-4-hydroxy-4-carboxy--5-ureidoimidazoline (OHCU) decarboxylase